METKAKKSTKSDEPLSRDVIIDCALKMADECGIENVSIRKIAAELGKSPMALYRHCDSMAEIQQCVVARAFEEVDTAPIPGERWDNTVRRTTKSVVAMYKRHSRAHLIRVQTTALDPGLRAHTDKVQALHSNQGIPADIYQRFWRIIDAYLSGFALNAEEEYETARRKAAANAEQHHDMPNWASMAQEAYSDQAFSDGLEIIIAGIRAQAAPDPCDWHTPEA